MICTKISVGHDIVPASFFRTPSVGFPLRKKIKYANLRDFRKQISVDELENTDEGYASVPRDSWGVSVDGVCVGMVIQTEHGVTSFHSAKRVVYFMLSNVYIANFSNHAALLIYKTTLRYADVCCVVRTGHYDYLCIVTPYYGFQYTFIEYMSFILRTSRQGAGRCFICY